MQIPCAIPHQSVHHQNSEPTIIELYQTAIILGRLTESAEALLKQWLRQRRTFAHWQAFSKLQRAFAAGEIIQDSRLKQGLPGNVTPI